MLHPPALAWIGSLEAMDEVLLEAVAMHVLDGALAAAWTGKVGHVAGLETDAALLVGSRA